MAQTGSSSKRRNARDEATRKVIAAEARMAAVSTNGRPKITLSTGVVLNLRPVPKQFIYEATRAFERPRVPVVLNKDKGREEENPADPDYQEAIQRHIIETANAATDVALLRGTEIAEKPETVPGPDDTIWIQEMEVLRMPMSDNPRARYLAWVKAVAAPTDHDILMLLGEVGRLTGVSEADVDDAVERFRRVTARDEDREPQVK